MFHFLAMFDVESYPTMMFFKGGGVNSGVQYQGSYAIEKLIEFSNLQLNRSPSDDKVHNFDFLKTSRMKSHRF